MTVGLRRLRPQIFEFECEHEYFERRENKAAHRQILTGDEDEVTN